MNGPKPASQAKKWVPVIIVFIVGAIFFFIFQSVHPFGLNSNSGTSNQAIVYSNQGINLLNEAKYDEAIANFNKAIEIDDKYANAYSGRGLAYYRMGQYDLAMADYNKAIELDPNDATAWHNKGVALEKLGRNEEAQVCYKMESQIDAINEAGGTQDNNTAGSVSGGTCAKTSCETGTCCHSVKNGEVVSEAVGVYVPASCACPSDTVPTEYESVVAGVHYRYCECK